MTPPLSSLLGACAIAFAGSGLSNLLSLAVLHTARKEGPRAMGAAGGLPMLLGLGAISSLGLAMSVLHSFSLGGLLAVLASYALGAGLGYVLAKKWAWRE
jgi:hypothetical protein